jgi:hypothetical protein
MCEFCEMDNNTPLKNEYAKILKYSYELTVFPDGDSWMITEPLLDLSDKTGNFKAAFKIKYCPMCGRKLGDAECVNYAKQEE